MTDLQHLQKVILEITKDIDQLCRENGIEYYLLGGSAIGAIRHKGFIPWDDDLDIIMTHEHYYKFLKLCREKLDPQKYFVQEALTDWPMLHSKIKLRGTIFEESGEYINKDNERGIFVDIFKLDNAAPTERERKWQYLCGKYMLCYSLLRRGYKEATLIKKMMMYAAFPLYIKPLRNFVLHQLTKYNNSTTEYYGTYGERYKYKATFYRKNLFEHPIYVPYEDTQLPVQEKYDECLTQLFGNYMTPPPVKEQVGWHLKGIDFGKY